ncbi:PTS mannitol transporter subunit IICBA [Nesterenkonia aerolata]|uniref:Mannitol-specific phosphotransferase enzyme IIA component n=1 Tax=Nesterenkonia aerolata TaxID=3074079 RepID=A0ABU2DTM9_9MICC|nr:PTS mannitol transporter subunit IICBA [Nesterenkonia sp. LY-0111]MDR8019853.1 PTS mannitol transporter subunit IICBA [Nesterenkonia sp. LY-0111]
MTATASEASAQTESRGGARVLIQRFGSFLSGMIMPNIPALIAWGILTAFVIPDGFTPNEGLATIVGPMIHYLLPLLIAMQGGRMIYEARGVVVAGIATFGVIAGSDWLILQQYGDEAGNYQIHMFIGAMIMGPLAAWVMKKLDGLWEGKVRSGFEMLVNMFSAGLTGFFLAVGGFYLLAPVVNWLMEVLGRGVEWLVDTGLLPLTSVIIEPAKVFFLNNAINHGVLTPLGVAESADMGKSVLFMLEANPGPGVGVLIAYTVFGVGAAKATAPGAALIQFVGGIHEVYFPYVLMKPALLLAVVAGGASGVAVNVVFDTGLRGPASPGSILAIGAQTAAGDYLGVMLSVVVAAGVSFAVAAPILLASRRRDLAAGGDQFSEAVAKTEANKGKSSEALSGLAAGAGSGAAALGTTVPTKRIETIIFACDAGMGSSAMGASVLKRKLKEAGITDVAISNKAIPSLPGNTDLVVTQQQLTDRARSREAEAVHVSVDSFMDAPEYDDIVRLVQESREDQGSAAHQAPEDRTATGEAQTAVVAPEAGNTEQVPQDGQVPQNVQAPQDVLTLDRVRIHAGAATQEQALTEAADMLVEAGAETSDYLEAMRRREETVSTFMGNELAIPHGTNDAKEAVLASALTVSRYDGGVDWAGKQATFVVGIAGVGKEHLTILSKIARLFSDKEAVQRLKAVETEEELLEMLNAVND